MNTTRSRIPRPSSQVVAAIAVALALGCSTTKADTRASAAAPGSAGAHGGTVLPASATGLENDLLGWVVVGDLDETFRVLASAQIHGVTAKSGDLKARVVAALTNNEALGDAVDSRRPIVVALIDPARHQGPHSLPIVVALPVASREKLTGAFRPASQPAAQADVAVFERDGGGRVYATFAPDQLNRPVAFLSFEPGIAKDAERLLSPLQVTPPRAAIVARVLLQNAARRHTDELQALLGAVLAEAAPGKADDPYTAYAMRRVRRAATHLAAAEALEVRIDAAPKPTPGLSVSLRIEDSRGGEWAKFVGEQQQRVANGSTTWGADLIPKDAVLVYSSRLAGEAAARGEAEDMVEYLVSLRNDQPPAARRDAWRATLTALGQILRGETIYAVWPAAGGGLGCGGAFKVGRDSAGREPRRLTAGAYEMLGPALGAAVARELGLDADRFRFKVQQRQGGDVAGVPTDLVVLTPAFPKEAKQEREAVRSLMGDEITLAIAFVGDRAVWTAGRDWRPRLEAMIQRSQGNPPHAQTILDVPAFAQAVAHQPAGQISLSYVSTRGLAHFIDTTVRTRTPLTHNQEKLLAPFLSAGADDAPIVVATRVDAVGPKAYEVTSFLPLPALHEIGHLGGAFWRVGLGLVMGPPPFPPLPAPPRAVNPPVSDEPTPSPQPGKKEEKEPEKEQRNPRDGRGA